MVNENPIFGDQRNKIGNGADGNQIEVLFQIKIEEPSLLE